MTIIFGDDVHIISEQLGDLRGNSLLMYHFAKVLWEHPDNRFREDELTPAGRVLRFDHYLERQVANQKEDERG